MARAPADRGAELTHRRAACASRSARASRRCCGERRSTSSGVISGAGSTPCQVLARWRGWGERRDSLVELFPGCAGKRFVRIGTAGHARGSSYAATLIRGEPMRATPSKMLARFETARAGGVAALPGPQAFRSKNTGARPARRGRAPEQPNRCLVAYCVQSPHERSRAAMSPMSVVPSPFTSVRPGPPQFSSAIDRSSPSILASRVRLRSSSHEPTS